MTRTELDPAAAAQLSWLARLARLDNLVNALDAIIDADDDVHLGRCTGAPCTCGIELARKTLCNERER